MPGHFPAQHTYKHQRRLLWLILPPLIILFILLDISFGSVNIPIIDVIGILTGNSDPDDTWYQIIINFRLPRIITAILVGIGLSCSGLLMQTLFNNPLAGPFVLGITSGASLGVALLMLAGSSLGMFLLGLGVFGKWLVVLAGCLGAASVLFVVVLISFRVKSSMTLLIVGLLFGSTTGALVSILQFFSNKEQIQSYLYWTFGSLGGLTWDEILVLVPIAIIGIGMILILRKPLNALLMGEVYAETLGINLRRVRLWIILATSILAGSITAFCGPIAFIGIAVPHLSRMIFNTGNLYLLVPASAMIGIIVMLICDIISQLPGSQYVIPINAITSLFGAPIVIWMVLRRKEIGQSFT